MKNYKIKASSLLAVFGALVFILQPAYVAAQGIFSLGSIDIETELTASESDEATGEVLAVSTETPSETPEEPEPIIVKVEKGDTLSKLAKAHNTTWRRLFDANTSIADPNIINPGEEIRVPFEDEKLEQRKLPAVSAKPVVRTTSRRTTPRVKSTAPAVASGSVWDRLAACESGGNWAINTGNGYYGGLQFLPSTWRAVGGTGLPHQHSRAEQIKRGKILQARSGWGQWPACARKLGLL